MTSKDRTSTICQVLYYFSVLSLYVVPLMLLGVWFYADQLVAGNGMIPDSMIQHPLPVTTKTFLVLLTAIMISPAYWGLFSLRRFLAACSTEDYLTLQNSRDLKRFAFGLMGTALISPITGAVLSVILTLHRPAGQKMLAINISSNQIILVAIGGLLFILANLLKRASLIADENAQIV
ncbi:DUF2975 domain-containing protein [Gimesia aquarii]|uniref:DUF2975 domain-containing protein n=1 Tax=Gimesia aquarii TaxID=2527964 RepID=A0A517WXW1_9PLAN|nr:DUF2975 domain-containing protein [Gimesia aquarii]QDU10097.1 hypothetical protein V202x_34960 [Gimesia aquarii]